MNNKANITKLILQLLFILLPLFVFGNGGPVHGCFTQKSGNLKLISKKDIKVLSEDLNIELTDQYVKVKVIYRLKNLGETDNVKYGFPIDYVKGDEYSHVSYCKTVSNFDFSFNGKALEYYVEEETNKSKIKGPFIDEGYTMSRDWYVTELKLEAGQTVLLEVSYSISSHYYYWGRDTDSRFSRTTNTRFLYDLSPCGFFGDGVIDTLSLSIKKPDNLCFEQITIKGLEELTYHNNYIGWYGENYNPSDKTLEIEYRIDPTNFETSEKTDHLNKSVVKNINVSSTLKGYPKENLIDLDDKTAWVEGVNGMGKGEWIEFEFNEKVFINGIGILNGYYKNGTVYNQNNRIKSLELSIKVEDIEENYLTNDTTVIELQPQCYYDDHFYENVQIIYDFGELGLIYNSVDEMVEKSNSTLKVKIKILETYSGEKYDDTCISEVLFYGYARDNQ
ncbi:discoidin domain-containing protein [Flammeovirga sp. EKP202]|uniref:discoidin domain-containing protein n=1 Tax=Flammeovirga sp. EKP202 TaxID=2770592 RepID=UPI00165FCA1F|nr:discoidin domain-containing protein [Flammeovirga sp. EKP202]MBD0400292.1 hypothetical protein [Flammeovirga sp. EKP202]